MPIITFENIVGDNQAEDILNGYRKLDWDSFAAVDDEVFEGYGNTNAIRTGEAAALSRARLASFKSPDSDNDFDLNSSFFTAFNANDLTVKVFGFDDGERVATKAFTVDVTQEFVTFGRKFDDIDEVRFTAKGGTDPDPNDGFGGITTQFAIDDLFIDF